MEIKHKKTASRNVEISGKPSTRASYFDDANRFADSSQLMTFQNAAT